MELAIRLDPLHDPRIAAFLQEHLADMHRVTPPESVHALDLAALRQPGIQFWTAWTTPPDAEALVATAALKRLDAEHAEHAELKSMRTTAALRGRGIAARMLAHVIAQARAQGFSRLSLETGTQPYFRSARMLYAKCGFAECAPFDTYQADPYSFFMSMRLS